jgi:hypothetical protein
LLFLLFFCNKLSRLWAGHVPTQPASLGSLVLTILAHCFTSCDPQWNKHILAKLIIYTRMPWHLFRHKLLCSDIYPDSSCQIFWHTFRHLSWHVVWLGLTCGLTFILTIWVFLGHMFWQWSWYQFWHLICKIFI